MLPALALLASALAVAPIDLKVHSLETRPGVEIRDVSFASAGGGRTAAYLVQPRAKGRYAGILYVHWYESESPDSNRMQFLNEATSLAKRGTVSLLIETMWSDPKWYRTRDQGKDYENSLRQVKKLRRALDVLLSRPNVDAARVAYVGHDFGAMYGIVMGAEDRRPRAYALQAGTVSFSGWYLYAPKLEGEARRRFIEQLAPLDPVKHIGKLGAPVLLQFSRKDFYVPEQAAKQLFDAAKEPKKILWYDAGHGLNSEAVSDRMAWLAERLRLPASVAH